jgi:hypothetical protein
MLGLTKWLLYTTHLVGKHALYMDLITHLYILTDLGEIFCELKKNVPWGEAIYIYPSPKD